VVQVVQVEELSLLVDHWVFLALLVL